LLVIAPNKRKSWIVPRWILAAAIHTL
jgi:hypothetical protein